MVFKSGSILSARNNYAYLRQERCFGTVLDRQDATVRLIRGVEVMRMVIWHASGSSNCCLPAGQFPQWK
eukprot:8782875-Pyramimonas_sp.AAC.1